jgi:hypothetical protein
LLLRVPFISAALSNTEKPFEMPTTNDVSIDTTVTDFMVAENYTFNSSTSSINLESPVFTSSESRRPIFSHTIASAASSNLALETEAATSNAITQTIILDRDNNSTFSDTTTAISLITVPMANTDSVKSIAASSISSSTAGAEKPTSLAGYSFEGSEGTTTVAFDSVTSSITNASITPMKTHSTPHAEPETSLPVHTISLLTATTVIASAPPPSTPTLNHLLLASSGITKQSMEPYVSATSNAISTSASELPSSQLTTKELIGHHSSTTISAADSAFSTTPTVLQSSVTTSITPELTSIPSVTASNSSSSTAGMQTFCSTYIFTLPQ